MIKFFGKVIANMLAMLVAAVLLVGGCLYMGSTAIQQAEEARRRNQANGNAEATPAATMPSVDAVFDSAEKSFAKGVAEDLIEQYDIVKNGTDEMAKSIRAGAVAEAFLQARDSAKYQAWKEKADLHMKKAMGN